jgi:fructose 1,6-bisphosphatase
MKIEEWSTDPIVVFVAGKTSAGSSFNCPISRMFTDPTNTADLVIDPPHMRPKVDIMARKGAYVTLNRADSGLFGHIQSILTSVDIAFKV